MRHSQSVDSRDGSLGSSDTSINLPDESIEILINKEKGELIGKYGIA